MRDSCLHLRVVQVQVSHRSPRVTYYFDFFTRLRSTLEKIEKKINRLLA